MSQSLYIHIPFCKSKCFYCSFVSSAEKNSLIPFYLEALAKEAGRYRGFTFQTVYIGGGTPTVLTSEHLRFLFKFLQSNFTFAPNAEVTCEVNPVTFDLGKAKLLRSEGVTRISLGVQSLNDKNLRWLGRLHSSIEARQAYEVLQKAGFANISLDLIYGLPKQSDKDIEDDVRGLIAWKSQHVSLYALSISKKSLLFKKKIKMPSPEAEAKQYRFVTSLLKGSGFNHYEVSNFSRRGFECRHNINYWRGGNYVGLGAGAHSHQEGKRFWNTDSIEKYIRMIREKGSAQAGTEALGDLKRFMETFLIGLRLNEGVDTRALESRFGIAIPDEKIEILKDFLRQGLLVSEGDRFKATLDGMVVLDEMCSRLV